MNTVQEALSTIYKFEEIHYWTDKKAVLFWLKGNKELKQFVANRKSEVLSLRTGTIAWELITLQTLAQEACYHLNFRRVSCGGQVQSGSKVQRRTGLLT